jgi:hypothetical protein
MRPLIYNKTKYLELLKECCRMRGNPQELIHRTITEFADFQACVIWGENYKEEEQEIYKFGKENLFHYDRNNTLEAWIELFHKWCYKIYITDNKDDRI